MTASAERIPSEYPHTAEVPCMGCRWLVKGSELYADQLWHEACGHFHESGACPEVKHD